MIPNNMNSAIHLLNSCNSLFVYYRQNISYKEGLFTDSSYINNITINKNTITIDFPEACDIIDNITISSSSIKSNYKVIADDDIINGIILLKKYKKVQLLIFSDDFTNMIISFDVYLLKKRLLSML